MIYESLEKLLAPDVYEEVDKYMDCALKNVLRTARKETTCFGDGEAFILSLHEYAKNNLTRREDYNENTVFDEMCDLLGRTYSTKDLSALVQKSNISFSRVYREE